MRLGELGAKLAYKIADEDRLIGRSRDWSMAPSIRKARRNEAARPKIKGIGNMMERRESQLRISAGFETLRCADD